MGSPEYRRWLRDRQREEDRAGPEDADIRADDAHENRHRHRYYDHDDDRWVERVSMRHWTAGTWAQLLLMGLYWFGFGYLIYGTGLGPRDDSLKTILLLLALIPAIIAGVLTWRSLGRQSRDRLRTLVRISPLLLVGLLFLSAYMKPKGRDGDRPARSAQPTSASVARETEPAPNPRAPPSRLPPSALPSLALAPGLSQLEGWWRERQACLRHLSGARRVPSFGGPSLREGFECVRRTESERGGVVQFAARHEAELLARAQTERPPSPAVLLALGHLETAPRAVALLVELARRPELSRERAVLDALTESGLRWPAELEAELRLSPGRAEPAAALLFASVLARTQAERSDACETLMRLALDEEDHDLSQSAKDRLRELAPHCPRLVETLLQAVERLAKQPVGPGQATDFAASAYARLAEHGRPQDFGPLVRAARGLEGRQDLHLTRGALLEAAQDLVERAFEREVGLSSHVFGHPLARAVLPTDGVKTGPCATRRLGLGKKDAELGTSPSCIVEHSVPDWLRAPLEPWRAKLDGWDPVHYRSLTVPPAE